jgi:hypothetical protein
LNKLKEIEQKVWINTAVLNRIGEMRFEDLKMSSKAILINKGEIPTRYVCSLKIKIISDLSHPNGHYMEHKN